MKRNINAVDKIIKELSYRDFRVASAKFWKTHKKFDRKGNMIQFPGYSLSQDTMEAIEIKHEYLNGRITEEEYKAFCLRYNLRTF